MTPPGPAEALTALALVATTTAPTGPPHPLPTRNDAQAVHATLERDFTYHHHGGILHYPDCAQPFAGNCVEYSICAVRRLWARGIDARVRLIPNRDHAVAEAILADRVCVLDLQRRNVLCRQR